MYDNRRMGHCPALPASVRIRLCRQGYNDPLYKLCSPKEEEVRNVSGDPLTVIMPDPPDSGFYHQQVTFLREEIAGIIR
jgi:hypothetical protein